MPIDFNSIYGNQSSLRTLVDQYMRLESRPRDELVEKKEALYERKKVLNELNSKLSTLRTRSERLNDPVTDYFATKRGLSSDAELFLVSTTSNAALGSHSLTVERLAVADTRVSKQYTNTDSSFTGFTSDQTFSIEVAHPTDEDPENRLAIEVTVSAATFAKNDKEVLTDIVTAINEAVNSAVLSATINNDEGLEASLISEVSGKSRLVLRSRQSGYDYRIDLTDSADSLLAALEANADIQSTGTAGGYMTEVGTGTSNSQLNSKFTIDSLTFYRNSNTISDALGGVTLQLLNTFSTAETITVNSDTSSVKDEIRGFIDSYNDILGFLVDNAGFNAETRKYGELANDVKYRGIKTDLWKIVTGRINGVSNSNFNRLFDIGIVTKSDGSLYIKDADKLETALKTNSRYVSDLFNNSTDGIVIQLQNYVTNMVKSGGSISTSKQVVDQQVTNLEGRIKTQDEYLYKREKQLFSEFTRMQEMMLLISNQQNFFQQYTNGIIF